MNLDAKIDKSKVPPIYQKRILAFVNHFILTTCTFLNDFAIECETKFIDVERKLQRLEASLIIIEEKLASISGLDEFNKTETSIEPNNSTTAAAEKNTVTENASTSVTTTTSISETEIPVEEEENKQIAADGIKASEDARYRKFFKMIQFGVPMQAAKLKAISEGLNGEILDTPNLILIDGVAYQSEES